MPPDPTALVVPHDRAKALHQTDFEIIENLGQSWRAENHHNAFRLKLCNRTIVHSEIGRSVEARGVNDPVRLRRVLVKRNRPSASQVLALRPNDIRWHAHSDRIVAPEID